MEKKPLAKKKAKKLFQLGNNAYMNGEYEKALEYFDRALKIDPENASAWSNRGVVLKMLGRNEEAMKSYNRAIEIDPSHGDAWYNKGRLLMSMKRYKEAIHCYKKALEIDPDDIEARNDMAFCEEQMTEKEGYEFEAIDEAIEGPKKGEIPIESQSTEKKDEAAKRQWLEEQEKVKDELMKLKEEHIKVKLSKQGSYEGMPGDKDETQRIQERIEKLLRILEKAKIPGTEHLNDEYKLVLEEGGDYNRLKNIYKNLKEKIASFYQEKCDHLFERTTKLLENLSSRGIEIEAQREGLKEAMELYAKKKFRTAYKKASNVRKELKMMWNTHLSEVYRYKLQVISKKIKSIEERAGGRFEDEISEIKDRFNTLKNTLLKGEFKGLKEEIKGLRKDISKLADRISVALSQEATETTTPPQVETIPATTPVSEVPMEHVEGSTTHAEVADYVPEAVEEGVKEISSTTTQYVDKVVEEKEAEAGVGTEMVVDTEGVETKSVPESVKEEVETTLAETETGEPGIGVPTMEEGPTTEEIMEMTRKKEFERLFADGKKYKAHTRFFEAMECFEKATSLYPDNADAWRELAEAYLYLREYNRAKQAVEKAIELNEKDAKALGMYGTILDMIGQKDEALKYYDKALALENKWEDLWINRGVILYSKGDLDAAIESFRKAIEINTYTVETWINLGFVLEKKGDYRGAVDAYEHALTIDPNNRPARVGKEACMREIRREIMMKWAEQL